MILSCRKTIALAVLLSVAAAWLWAHEGHQALPTRGVSVDAEKGRVTLGPEAAQALNLLTDEVRGGTLEDTLVASATVTAPWQGHAFVSTRLGGTVTALHVQPGQSVQRGQKVAEVESLELIELQRELLEARNETRFSEETLNRVEALSLSGATPDQSLHQARSQHQQNLNALEIARRKLQGIGFPAEALGKLLRDGAPTLRGLPVVSPFAAVAVHVDVAVGQTVEPMEHLMEVIDSSRVWVQIRILEKDLFRVRVGQAVSFRLPVSPSGADSHGSRFGAGKAPLPPAPSPKRRGGETNSYSPLRFGEGLGEGSFHTSSGAPAAPWSGTLQVKERYLDPQSHWATVWAERNNPAGLLLPGMVGQARLTIASAGSGLLIPASALVVAGAERDVFVEEGPRQYRRQNVVVERARGDVVQITVSGGLYPGDRVVTAGSHELASLFVQGVLRLSPEAVRNIGLRIEPARRRRVAEVVTLSSMIDLPPGGRAVVSSRLPGVLHRIAVDRDQSVRAGEVVAEVASPELHTLQLDLLRSHLQLQLQEDNLRRLQAAGDSFPDRMILEAASALSSTRQRRDSIQNKLRSIGLSAEQVRGVTQRQEFAEGVPVRAPISGVVVRFRAALGQAVKPESPLFEIHDLSATSLRAFVPEQQLHRVRVGQRGRIRLTADADFAGEVVVTRQGRVVEDRSRTVPFWAELATPARSPLLPGMLGRLTLVLSESPPTLAVPRGAVLEEGALRYLFVRRSDDIFERRQVETGCADDRFVEITHGLAESESVAVSGVSDLQTAYASLQ